MIKPEQIPDAVVDALLDSSNVSLPWHHAIAAALNAWPNARMRTTFLPNDDGVWIVPQRMWSLPLPQENSDE